MDNEVHENQDVVLRLQNEAKSLLLNYELRLNGVSIIPKEIEVYFYKNGVFEDNSVHRNELQKNHNGHFYIHRWGTKETDPYKGGRYPGIDYVVSTNQEEYYSYLIRSAVVDDEIIVGPHKVLEAIMDKTHLSEKVIEKLQIELVSHCSQSQVLFSKRINLGKKVEEKYRNCRLRAVVCDEQFKTANYRGKGNMVVDFLLDELSQNKMDRKQALVFAKEYLGYITEKIRNN